MDYKDFRPTETQRRFMEGEKFYGPGTPEWELAQRRTRYRWREEMDRFIAEAHKPRPS